ncbi:hypothetical protein RJ639_044765, partial [Escallonia herrerae]
MSLSSVLFTYDMQIRTIMVDNIEKILERGDRIELLVDKTATMQDSAFHFKKQSKRLRRALWMKNAKLLTKGPQAMDYRNKDMRLSRSEVKQKLRYESAYHSYLQYRLGKEPHLVTEATIGLVDMLDRSVAVYNNCGLLWRHNSTILQIMKIFE